MTTALITHPACLRHEPPPGHPERPARLQSILVALEAEEFRPLLRKEAPEASLDAIARVHDRDYVEEVLAAIPTSGIVHFDADTSVSPGSREAIFRAAGALVLGVDTVVAGDAKNAFCAVRPPGHHALPARAMGFCIFNNVAIGAAYARAAHGLNRVAVVDFDVHHGNGTEAMFFSDPALFVPKQDVIDAAPGLAAAAHLDVILGAAAYRHGFVRQIGNPGQKLTELLV